MTTMTNEDIYSAIRLDNDGAKVVLDRYNTGDLETALERLSEPLKLSFTQRMVAKAFNFDVPSEISRFTRLIKETIEKKDESAVRRTLSEPDSIAGYQQNLK